MYKILIMIKNYTKLLWRRKAMIIITLIGLVVIVSTVANAFHTLLDKNDETGGFNLGYVIEEGSRYEPVEAMLMDEFGKKDIKTQRYNSADPMAVIESGEQDVFIDFGKDSYSITGNKKKTIETRIVQYSLYNLDRNMDSMMTGGLKTTDIKVGTIPETKVPEAENYYCHAFIVLFLTISPIYMSLIFYTERKQKIGQRLVIGNAGAAARYFGKFGASFITGMAVLPLAGTLLFKLMFKMEIGDVLIYAGIMTLTGIAFTAFGIIFLLLFRQPAVSIGLMFMILWVLGFIGGAFETYIYSSIPEIVKRVSPVYYINRSLLEISVNGRSDFLMPCVIYLAAMAVVLIPLGILITRVRKEV